MGMTFTSSLRFLYIFDRSGLTWWRGGLTSALSRLGIGCNILGYDGPQLCSVADSASKKKESSRSLAFENGC